MYVITIKRHPKPSLYGARVNHLYHAWHTSQSATHVNDSLTTHTPHQLWSTRLLSSPYLAWPAVMRGPREAFDCPERSGACRTCARDPLKPHRPVRSTRAGAIRAVSLRAGVIPGGEIYQKGRGSRRPTRWVLGGGRGDRARQLPAWALLHSTLPTCFGHCQPQVERFLGGRKCCVAAGRDIANPSSGRQALPPHMSQIQLV